MVINYDFLTDGNIHEQDTESALNVWLEFVERVKNTTNSIYLGEFLMKNLVQTYPNLSEDFRNTSCDPTHREEVVPIFLDCVERAWRSRIRYAKGD